MIRKRLSDEELMGMAEELIEEFPDDLRQALNHVDILIQDRPTSEQYARLHLPEGRMLLGLYEGVPLSRRSVFQVVNFPSTIILFRDNIERLAGIPSQIRDELRFTLFHEIGHHLGYSEEDLRQRGL